MDIFTILSLIGGLVLFLYGMDVMGDALKKSAGRKLKTILGNLTSNKWKGFLLGLAVTAVIQSSSATTVMVVGFVNSGIMKLKQAVGIIIGANVGTTVTAWILSLGGISGDTFWLKIFKPTSFTPVLMIIGVIMLMACKTDKKRNLSPEARASPRKTHTGRPQVSCSLHLYDLLGRKHTLRLRFTGTCCLWIVGLVQAR